MATRTPSSTTRSDGMRKNSVADTALRAITRKSHSRQTGIFGTIDGTGLATLDKIAKAGVAGGGDDGKPATDVKVKSILLE